MDYWGDGVMDYCRSDLLIRAVWLVARERVRKEREA